MASFPRLSEEDDLEILHANLFLQEDKTRIFTITANLKMVFSESVLCTFESIMIELVCFMVCKTSQNVNISQTFT